MEDWKESFLGCSFGLGCFVFLIILGGIVGAICWPYTLNSWLIFFGKMPKVIWWHGFILGLLPFFGYASIPAAIITWILLMFLT